MKQRLALVVILLALTTIGIGQAKPNLNGTWVRKVAPDAEKNKQDILPGAHPLARRNGRSCRMRRCGCSPCFRTDVCGRRIGDPWREGL